MDLSLLRNIIPVQSTGAVIDIILSVFIFAVFDNVLIRQGISCRCPRNRINQRRQRIDNDSVALISDRGSDTAVIASRNNCRLTEREKKICVAAPCKIAGNVHEISCFARDQAISNEKRYPL
jgi:hypothetical protein